MADLADSDEAPTLSERQQQILRAVCRDFVMTGDGVASSALIGRHGFRWSSATLRQELSTLERMGLLRRAHRSAGCSPTERGLYLYVRALPAGGTPQPELMRAVDHSLRRSSADRSHGMRAAVCVLSEVSGCLAVSFLGTAHGGRMDQVDVVPLVGPRALVVLTLEGGGTHFQPIELEELPEGVEPGGELRHLQERLRWLCVGRTLSDAREVLEQRLGEHEFQVDRMFAQALRVALSLCAVRPLDPLCMQMAGQPALARGVSDGERLEDVLRLLDDDQRLAEVLDQLLPADNEDDSPRAQVHWGVGRLLGAGRSGRDDGADELATPGIAPGLSLVGCRVPTAADGPDRGAVALVGPARMDYATMIPLVEYAARALAARICA